MDQSFGDAFCPGLSVMWILRRRLPVVKTRELDREDGNISSRLAESHATCAMRKQLPKCLDGSGDVIRGRNILTEPHARLRCDPGGRAQHNKEKRV